MSLSPILRRLSNSFIAQRINIRCFSSIPVSIQENHYTSGFPQAHYNYPDLKLEGIHFDPSKHLQIELPSYCKDMNFKDIEFPYNNEQSKINGNIAYTRPFRVLSDEGINFLRTSISENESKLALSDARAPLYIRGLGFLSNFHREFIYHPEIINVINALSRDKLTPHSMTRNISHTNIGKPAYGKPVDKWHTDSADYALVIILSDLTDMEGGELRVLQCPDASGSEKGIFKTLQTNGVPEDLIETIKYTGPGYAILMQGSKILHTVNEVFKAKEPRISLVNSYMTCRSFMPDMTRYSTFVDDDGIELLSLEYSRGKAWRIKGQMDYILNEAKIGTKPELLSSILRNAADELIQAADLIEGKKNDHPKWLD